MVIITAVYIPPQADTDMALSDLHDVLCRCQIQHPDTAVVVALDHCYTPFKRDYKAASLPPYSALSDCIPCM